MFQFIRTDDSKLDSTLAEKFRGDSGVSDTATGDALDSATQIATKPAVSVEKLDRAGAVASFLCAIHCALMPLVVTLLPLLGLSFLASEPVEWALLAASATLGSWSLCLGFRQHRSRRVFMILGVALALLVAGRIFHQPHFYGFHVGEHHSHERHFGAWGPILMVLGGLTMMSAHLLNHRLCHACKRCSSGDCHG